MRTYLFTYSNVYDSISIPILAEMFELEENCVHALVSKMIINEELMASLDQPSQCIVMHRTEPSRVQALALQLSDILKDQFEGKVFPHEPTPDNIEDSIGQPLFVIFRTLCEISEIDPQR